jgi:hypothetical protein
VLRRRWRTGGGTANGCGKHHSRADHRSGYGTDPAYQARSALALGLTDDQRASLRIAADLMLPADGRSPSGSALVLTGSSMNG